ncbi:MAG: c-type cytochrome [Gammaproteobacteria bacterium]
MKKFALLLFMALLAPLSVQADTVAEMLAHLKEVQADPAALEKAVKAGGERALLCAYCHGEDGNSVKGHIPHLAGQNAKYLLTQFQLFADGTRKDFVMSDLAKSLKAEEQVNIILYFSRNPVKPSKLGSPSLMEKGKQIYQGFCHGCHGLDGRGNEDLPRLAGQPKEYLQKTLAAFKNKDESRASSIMVNIVDRYSHDDLKAVAEYLTGLE